MASSAKKMQPYSPELMKVLWEQIAVSNKARLSSFVGQLRTEFMNDQILDDQIESGHFDVEDVLKKRERVKSLVNEHARRADFPAIVKVWWALYGPSAPSAECPFEMKESPGLGVPPTPASAQGTGVKRKPDEIEHVMVDEQEEKRGGMHLCGTLDGDARTTRYAAALAANELLWPVTQRTLPYSFLDKTKGQLAMKYSAPEKKVVQSCMKEWTEKTGIQFVESDTTEAVIRIAKGGRWQSLVGRQAEQSTDKEVATTLMPSIAADEDRKHILHELGHCLGLKHEHQRADRNLKFNKQKLLDYCAEKGMDGPSVQDNIMGALQLDDKDLRTPYDPKSIMHYYLPSELFLTPPDPPLSDNKKLSELDLKFIQSLYPTDFDDNKRKSSMVAYAQSLYSLSNDEAKEMAKHYNITINSAMDVFKQIHSLHIGGNVVIINSPGGGLADLADLLKAQQAPRAEDKLRAEEKRPLLDLPSASVPSLTRIPEECRTHYWVKTHAQMQHIPGVKHGDLSNWHSGNQSFHHHGDWGGFAHGWSCCGAGRYNFTWDRPDCNVPKHTCDARCGPRCTICGRRPNEGGCTAYCTVCGVTRFDVAGCTCSNSACPAKHDTSQGCTDSCSSCHLNLDDLTKRYHTNTKK